jgi:hypothetical protein
MDPRLRAWLADLRTQHESAGDSAGIMAGVARAVGRHIGVAWSPSNTAHLRLGGADPATVPSLPPTADPLQLLGTAHEALLAPATRKAGAHYTPPAVARGLTAIAVRLAGTSPAERICDPAAGGGAFLLAAAAELAAAGVEPRRVVADRLWGADLDDGAVAVTEAALALWAARAEGSDRLPAVGEHLVVADVLDPEAEPWVDAAQCDVVVGNPPFQSQLARATARDRRGAGQARARFGSAVAAYTDTAALFLLAAVDLVRPGGVVVLVQPASFLAARDASPVRRILARRAAVVGLWVAGTLVFEANVRVCAPVLRVGHAGRQPDRVRRWTGGEVRPAASVTLRRDQHEALVSGASWASLTGGGPTAGPAALRSAGRLGDRCTATAGFRQHFYGLVPFVHEGANGSPVPLVTCGLIDPGTVLWGRRRARFGGRHFDRPAVDVAALTASGDDELCAWIEARLRPKVVVATQTRVVEAAVDQTGSWVPSVPVLSVEADPDDLWLVAAVLLAPPVTAWALDRVAGTALSADAIKLTARHVVEIPTPADTARWRDAAEHLQRAATAPAGIQLPELIEIGSAMASAYGHHPDDPVVRWWSGRLPSAHRYAPADVVELR